MTDMALAPVKRIAGQPIALFLVAVTEFFIALSYFAVQGMFVLFLTSSSSDGGIAMGEAQAIFLVGLVFGFAFLLPVLGGLIADRFLGHRLAVKLGLAALAIGYFALAATGWFIDRESSSLSPEVFVYIASSMVAIGRGLVTASNCLLAVRVYPDDDPAKDAGWTIFYGAAGLGYFLSNILIGTIGEQVSWQAGFATAGVTQLVGLAIFIILGRSLLANLTEHDRASEHRPPLSEGERAGLVTVAILFPFFLLFATAFSQSISVVNLFVFEHVDRTVGGFVIPATWFQSLIPGFGFLCMPFFAWLSLRLARSERDDLIVDKFTAALVFSAIGTTALVLAALRVQDGAMAAPWWIVAFAFLLNAADYLIMPTAMTLIAVITPKHQQGMIIGLWLTGWGIGNILAGTIGGVLRPYGDVVTFSAIATMLVTGAVFVFILRGYWRTWYRKAKLSG